MALHSSALAGKIPWIFRARAWKGGAWSAAVHGVVKNRTRLSIFTFTFCFHALEKEMATHSSVLAWRIPGTWEPGRLPSMGSHRVGQDWSDLAAAASSVPLYEWFRIYLFTSWRTFRLFLETFIYMGFVWIQISISLGQIPQKQDFWV